VIGVALQSCFVPGFEVLEVKATTSAQSTGQGGATNAGSGGAGGSGGCTHKYPTEAPAMSDGGADSVEFVAAIRSIDIGESSIDTLGPIVGFDLDKTCSCSGEGHSCKIPAGANEKDHCDGPGGIDNVTARIFKDASPFAPSASSTIQSGRAENGEWSLLIRVKGYNGKANDDKVTVALHPSPGLRMQPCTTKDEKPKWDGSDLWPVDVVSLGQGSGDGSNGGNGCMPGVKGFTFDKPLYADDKAYVANNVMVANIPDADLVLSGKSGQTVIRLKAGFVTGTIEKGANGYKIVKGTLAGRWPLSDVFKSISKLVSSSGTELCTDNNTYKLIKTRLCSVPDITAGLAGPTTPCDAISFATNFETEPAKLGVTWKAMTSPPGCPAGTDPANDSCDKK
jgi:hypothetical protein